MRLAATLLILASAALAQSPEQRAINYLAREAPRWYFENRCYSCHNNGDAVRVLYLARSEHRKVPPEAFAGETPWLNQPWRWDRNRPNPAFDDPKLAWIQFSAALTEATKTGAVRNPIPAVAAAGLVRIQAAGGSWPIVRASDPASPATWGTPLATYMARTALESIDRKYFAAEIARSNDWFAAFEPASTFDAAVKLLALPRVKDLAPKLLEAQSLEGGWGPRPSEPPQAFDTAMVVLALQKSRADPVSIRRGREYLIRLQQPDGSWPETTRPPNRHSYAEHISTSAWAAQALFATDPKRWARLAGGSGLF
ncbi:MAG TPA: prenyltransferase/squalene oxidase repeat-containing protein [Bryobacteraceae bacterium]|nr:prenyltransferase/squalene oxidase repeat-containing protein [Bryobacteraceae bacterium]